MPLTIASRCGIRTSVVIARNRREYEPLENANAVSLVEGEEPRKRRCLRDASDQLEATRVSNRPGLNSLLSTLNLFVFTFL